MNTTTEKSQLTTQQESEYKRILEQVKQATTILEANGLSGKFTVAPVPISYAIGLVPVKGKVSPLEVQEVSSKFGFKLYN